MPPRQQNLFDASPPEWEADAQVQRRVASVVLTKGPDRQFDYEVPEGFCDEERPDRFLEVGRRVRVPFGRGNRDVVGYCVGLETKAVDAARIKPIARVLDSQSLLSPAMLRLTRWMADYYLCPWGQVLEAVVPAGVRGKAGTRAVKLLSVPPDVRDQLEQLKLRSKQQQKALRMLAASSHPLTAAALAEQAGCTVGPVRQLLKHGLVEAVSTRVASGELDDIRVDRDQAPRLSADQQAALDATLAALESSRAHGLLLHGVTGSGKTEVYLQAIERVISFGRQAIVLVPEISLTPQTVRRFRSRFEHVAVLHSHLTDVERHWHWQRISQGEVQVVVGARSAVFAPTPHLGLIVIDEEHESTFKQDSAPRYHARDVAWQRACGEDVPLLLGSATPSLEAWHRASAGQFRLLSLPRRVLNRPLPDVLIVDLREQAQSRYGRGAISRPLNQAMAAALRDGGQVILLLNRRGFSTHIQCPRCGFVLKCPDCEMSLTFHRQHNSALCHCCEHEESPPSACPDCKSPAIRYGGLGTQKLESEVRSRFKDYIVERMDTDSMRGRGSHEEVLQRFRDGKIDILVGTQMIAKGLDFPNVTLVGVVNADTALHLTDFRAAERTFQLAAQVAGRTGRGSKGGRVLVQTFQPDHPAIVAAARHDYERFAAGEMEIRQLAHYPPFGAMARLVVRGKDEAAARESAQLLGRRLHEAVKEAAAQESMDATGQAIAHPDGVPPDGSQAGGGVRILGPAPAPIIRLRGEYRFHLQLQAPEMPILQHTIRAATEKFRPPRGIVWTIDIDPWDMM